MLAADFLVQAANVVQAHIGIAAHRATIVHSGRAVHASLHLLVLFNSLRLLHLDRAGRDEFRSCGFVDSGLARGRFIGRVDLLI